MTNKVYGKSPINRVYKELFLKHGIPKYRTPTEAKYIIELTKEYRKQIAKIFNLSYHYDLIEEPPSDFWGKEGDYKWN